MHNAMTAAFLAYPTETFSNALLVSLMVPSVLWLWWRTETESATAWDPARTQTGNRGTRYIQCVVCIRYPLLRPPTRSAVAGLAAGFASQI